MENSLSEVLELAFVPRSQDLALLVLRLWGGASLFCLHGLEKVTRFSQMAAHFPDPMHIGQHASLAFALFSDAICSVLIFFGLATRPAALVIVTNLTVALCLVHKFVFSGPHSGEFALLYLGIAWTLLIAGPGRFSIDRALS